MAQEKIIIGLVGSIASGKGAVADFLKKRGFWAISLSDRIREELKRERGEITREALQATADQLRKKFGPAVLAERTWQKVTEQGFSKTVIDSIRGEAEVDYLKSKDNFYLIGVKAPRRKRFLWAKERNREGEPLSWREFVAVDKKDFKSGRGKMGRNITVCLEKSDFLINNNGTIKELEIKVLEILKKIKQNG